ncbi:MAG: leucine-rich repeat domain-containing protein [Candidatus Heimdallarchaeota archaeon]|nr:leucine-rich repeat domain-containing protein [Candidatus Heimdallarchaeota archaeon]
MFVDPHSLGYIYSEDDSPKFIEVLNHVNAYLRLIDEYSLFEEGNLFLDPKQNHVVGVSLQSAKFADFDFHNMRKWCQQVREVQLIVSDPRDSKRMNNWLTGLNMNVLENLTSLKLVLRRKFEMEDSHLNVIENLLRKFTQVTEFLIEIRPAQLQVIDQIRLPDILESWMNLKVLTIKGIHNISMGSEFGQLRGLLSLSLINCGLKRIPASVSLMTGLEFLDLSVNDITTIDVSTDLPKNLLNLSIYSPYNPPVLINVDKIKNSCLSVHQNSQMNRIIPRRT